VIYDCKLDEKIHTTEKNFNGFGGRESKLAF